MRRQSCTLRLSAAYCLYVLPACPPLNLSVSGQAGYCGCPAPDMRSLKRYYEISMFIGEACMRLQSGALRQPVVVLSACFPCMPCLLKTLACIRSSWNCASPTPDIHSVKRNAENLGILLQMRVYAEKYVASRM